MLDYLLLNKWFKNQSYSPSDLLAVYLPFVFVLTIKALIYAGFPIYTIIPQVLLCLNLIYFIKDAGKLFLLIPPLLFLSEQAPTQIGFNEAYLGALSLIISLYSIPYILRSISSSKIVAVTCLCAFLFILLNLLQALGHEIPVTDWIRAVAPFLFIGMLWAAKEFIFDSAKNKRLFLSSLCLTLLIFSLRVIYVYIDSNLCKMAWYHFHEGIFSPITENELSLYPSDSVFYFKKRITTILPEATNILVPLGSIIGALQFIFSTKRSESIISSVILTVSIAAVTLTVTRSMILCIAVVILMQGIAIMLLYRTMLKRYLLVLLMLVISFSTTCYLASLDDVYNNRLFVTISGLSNVFTKNIHSTESKLCSREAQTEPPKVISEQCATGDVIGLDSNQVPQGIQDENLNARIEEYKKAFVIFLQNPILGAGFGVKHEMLFDMGHGYILKQEVGYIHNWVLYFLMVGGVVGLLIYSSLLAYPFFNVFKTARSRGYLLIASTVAMLGCYGLFFAVFRLISFNVILALCWGYLLALNKSKDV